MLNQIKLDANNDWFILTEKCNYLVNSLGIKYYQLWSKANGDLKKSYETKWKYYNNLIRDVDLFLTKEKMKTAIELMNKDLKSIENG